MILSPLKPPLSFPTVSGSICTFNSQYAGLPLKAHTVDIDSVSGVSAINIYSPDNIIDYGSCVKGYISITGSMTGQTANKEYTSDYITVIPSTKITWWADIVATDSQWVAFSWYDSNGDFIQRVSWNYSTQIYTRTVTAPNNAVSVRMSWRNFSDNISNVYLFVTNQGLHTIQIGQTVNEATYNAKTGELEVTQPTVQTLQLPPCPIDTLAGVNNIWADTGDTTLQYSKFG